MQQPCQNCQKIFTLSQLEKSLTGLFLCQECSNKKKNSHLAQCYYCGQFEEIVKFQTIEEAFMYLKRENLFKPEFEKVEASYRNTKINMNKNLCRNCLIILIKGGLNALLDTFNLDIEEATKENAEKKEPIDINHNNNESIVKDKPVIDNGTKIQINTIQESNDNAENEPNITEPNDVGTNTSSTLNIVNSNNNIVNNTTLHIINNIHTNTKINPNNNTINMNVTDPNKINTHINPNIPENNIIDKNINYVGPTTIQNKVNLPIKEKQPNITSIKLPFSSNPLSKAAEPKNNILNTINPFTNNPNNLMMNNNMSYNNISSLQNQSYTQPQNIYQYQQQQQKQQHQYSQFQSSLPYLYQNPLLSTDYSYFNQQKKQAIQQMQVHPQVQQITQATPLSNFPSQFNDNDIKKMAKPINPQLIRLDNLNPLLPYQLSQQQINLLNTNLQNGINRFTNLNNQQIINRNNQTVDINNTGTLNNTANNNGEMNNITTGINIEELKKQIRTMKTCNDIQKEYLKKLGSLLENFKKQVAIHQEINYNQNALLYNQMGYTQHPQNNFVNMNQPTQQAQQGYNYFGFNEQSFRK